MKRAGIKPTPTKLQKGYSGLIGDISQLLNASRHATARVVNSFMTATYWEVGRRIVEFEQGGRKRAEYGKELLNRVSDDLTAKFGRGFGVDNLQRFRTFYLLYPADQIYATLSRKSADSLEDLGPMTLSEPNYATLSRNFKLGDLARRFPLPWSHYIRLFAARSDEARIFYEAEALRGGWSVRQLDRQMNSLFYERTASSKDKAAMLKKGTKAESGDALTTDEAVRDPLVLEFLNLKDEYSETELEAALIAHLETFLLELGSDFAFVGRQRRLRIDDEWYRVDLLFFHRRLRCLVILDLKLGKFTHADAGQMHMYLNYAREHWAHEDENPPVGLILCSSASQNVVHYALDNLSSKVLAKEYRVALPNEKQLVEAMEKARHEIELRT